VNGFEHVGLLVVEGWRQPEIKNGPPRISALPSSPR